MPARVANHRHCLVYHLLGVFQSSIQNCLFVCFFIIVVLFAFRFALFKRLHFIFRSLTAISSPPRSLVSQRFVSTVQGLSGDSTKDSSAKVINKNCQLLAVFGKLMCLTDAMCVLYIQTGENF